MVLSQAEVEDELRRLTSEMMHQLPDEIADAAQKFAHREHDFKVGYAKEYLKAEGSIETRKMLATVATEDEHLAWKIAEATLKTKRDKMTAYRSSIDGLRTLLVSIRENT